MAGANAQEKRNKDNSKDGWVMERSLGTGGFGVVNLWRHEETAQILALKHCRAVNEMKPKHKERWQMECQIMIKLNHPNVINALPVPEALREKPGELPVLAMEFCSEGDLRKVLNLPQNCCGLPEAQVRTVSRDISSAIEYLHKRHIIHRDLKPENIVLQNADDKIVYKLIDLGYAKDLEESSLCISFVGTMQYLAPELFQDTRYNHTVDYWSFGTTLFECITGIRPFLHNLPPIRWQNHVSQKKNDHIHAYMGAGGKPCFSENLPSPNNLCRITQPFFEQFLRLILRWNPQERGGDIYSDQRQECFHKFEENIVRKKVIHIFCVPSTTELTYPVLENHTVQDIQSVIAQESEIPVGQQELLHATGVNVKPSALAKNYCAKIGEEDMALFLFCRNDTTFPQEKRQVREFPEHVKIMLREPKALMKYDEKKKSWSQAVYYITSISRDFQHLVDAQRATNVYLMRCKSTFVNRRNYMLSVKEDLNSRITFFQTSIEFDLKKLEKQQTSGVYSRDMHSHWDTMQSSVIAYKSLVGDAKALDGLCSAFDVRVIELQRSPFAKTKQIDKIQQICKQSTDIYMDMRKMSQEYRKHPTDNEKMLQLVKACIKEWDLQSRDIYMHLSKIQECRKELEKLQPRVEEVISKMNEANDHILSFQRSRQNDVWSLVRKAFKCKATQLAQFNMDTGPASGLSTPPSSGGLDLIEQQQPPFPITATGDQVASSQVRGSRRDNPTSLQLIQESSQASIHLRNECTYTKHQLESVMRTSLHNSGDNHASLVTYLDWSFLDAASSGMDNS